MTAVYVLGRSPRSNGYQNTTYLRVDSENILREEKFIPSEDAIRRFAAFNIRALFMADFVAEARKLAENQGFPTAVVAPTPRFYKETGWFYHYDIPAEGGLLNPQPKVKNWLYPFGMPPRGESLNGHSRPEYCLIPPKAGMTIQDQRDVTGLHGHLVLRGLEAGKSLERIMTNQPFLWLLET